jgi:hypothetical protein
LVDPLKAPLRPKKTGLEGCFFAIREEKRRTSGDNGEKAEKRLIFYRKIEKFS